MEWFERWFGEEYLLVYEHRNKKEAEREVETIAQVLNLKDNMLLLDLCCGSGRHDIPLVQRGYRIVGLDLSMPLLSIAQKSKSSDTRYPLYIQADVKNIPLRSGIFDAVLNLFTSFGYFDDKENFELLLSISRLLKVDGHFYIDYLNPSRVLDDLVEESVKEKNSIKITEKRTYNDKTHRIEKTIHLDHDGTIKTFHESVRLYTIDEMRSMIKRAGLHILDVLGSVTGEPYSKTSERMILSGFKK